jgi:signal peptidase I
VASALGTVAIVAFCVFLVVGSLLFALNQDPRKSLFGYRFYTVLTGSMTPGASNLPGGFSAGDMIFVKMNDPATIKTGDIITYTTDPDGSAYLTHRVVDIKTEVDGQPGLWFITRGDTNRVDDPPVSANRVIGTKVFSIPMLGAILQQIRSNPIPFVVFIAAALGLTFALRAYFSKSKAKQNPGAPPLSVEQPPTEGESHSPSSGSLTYVRDDGGNLKAKQNPGAPPLSVEQPPTEGEGLSVEQPPTEGEGLSAEQPPTEDNLPPCKAVDIDTTLPYGKPQAQIS